MKKYQIMAALGVLSVLSSCSSSGLAGNSCSANGKPLLTRSSHPMAPTSYKGEGKHVGRKYFHPPGSKTGVQWVDLYEQP
ncbi:MAG: hypothetical protein RLZZ553_536 [Verrucomicrobiota bacterium]|jgi:hypothetical protein